MKDCIKHTNKHTHGNWFDLQIVLKPERAAWCSSFWEWPLFVDHNKQSLHVSSQSNIHRTNCKSTIWVKNKKRQFCQSVNLHVFSFEISIIVSVASSNIILFFNFGKVTRPFGFHSNKGGEKNVKSQVTQTSNTTAGSDDNYKKEEQSIYFKMKTNN